MLKLYYFPIPWRAEPFRIMMRVAKLPYEEVRFGFDEWTQQYKAKAPSGQCPFIELGDGTLLSQSLAINLYAAAQAGMMHQDPVQAARAVELAMCCDEVRAGACWRVLWELRWSKSGYRQRYISHNVQVMTRIVHTFEMQEHEKVQAREELLREGGSACQMLQVIDRLLEKQETPFYCGSELSVADMYILTLAGGMFGSGYVSQGAQVCERLHPCNVCTWISCMQGV
jgi:glutathione S-transferase